jgi:predicted CopG family antitoxin
MHMHIHMSSKNVAVRQDVYDALRRERRPRESFTLLMLRLLNQRGPVAELHGSWGADHADADHRRWRQLRFGGGRT